MASEKLLTEKRFLELLDKVLDKKLDEKLDKKFREFEQKMFEDRTEFHNEIVQPQFDKIFKILDKMTKRINKNEKDIASRPTRNEFKEISLQFKS